MGLAALTEVRTVFDCQNGHRLRLDGAGVSVDDVCSQHCTGRHKDQSALGYECSSALYNRRVVSITDWSGYGIEGSPCAHGKHVHGCLVSFEFLRKLSRWFHRRLLRQDEQSELLRDHGRYEFVGSGNVPRPIQEACSVD